jgi:hypothetical protein
MADRSTCQAKSDLRGAVLLQRSTGHGLAAVKWARKRKAAWSTSGTHLDRNMNCTNISEEY